MQYVFTDKTGTLTENEMCFRRCSVNSKMYCEDNGKLYILPESGLITNAVLLDTWMVGFLLNTFNTNAKVYVK